MTPRSLVLATAVASLAMVALVTAPAQAQPASTHENAATAAYEAGDLDTALREFEAAYAETQRDDLLYVIGRLHAERTECKLAIEHFERYLATGPGPNATEGARAEIATCEQVLAAEPGGGAGSGDGASPPPLPPVGGTTAITDTPRRPTRDLVAIGLVGGGVAAEVAAIVIYTRARSAQCGDPVCNGVTYDAYLAAEDRARSLRLTSIIVAGVGGALLAGGAVRYLTHARRREPTVGLVPTRGGGTLVLGGRF